MRQDEAGGPTFEGSRKDQLGVSDRSGHATAGDQGAGHHAVGAVKHEDVELFQQAKLVLVPLGTQDVAGVGGAVDFGSLGGGHPVTVNEFYFGDGGGLAFHGGDVRVKHSFFEPSSADPSQPKATRKRNSAT